MHNKQVIIFGGSGFLGRYITRLLSQEGFRVRVATRNVAATEFLRVSGDVGQILPLEVDYSKEDSIFQASNGVDYVINLTGILSENFYIRKPQTSSTIRMGMPHPVRKSWHHGPSRVA